MLTRANCLAQALIFCGQSEKSYPQQNEMYIYNTTDTFWLNSLIIIGQRQSSVIAAIIHSSLRVGQVFFFSHFFAISQRPSEMSRKYGFFFGMKK